MISRKSIPVVFSAQNRKARHNYFIEETLEAGIVLLGTEVKSLRAGRGNISEAYATENNREIYLFNAHISEYSGGNQFNHEPRRPRKLLLHQRQIARLTGKVLRRGYTLIPLSVYFNNNGHAKIQLGLARGKRQYDKRATIKERDWKRQKERLLKSNS